LTRRELLKIVGRRLRDDAHSLYTEELLNDGFNLGIDRIRQEIATLRIMPYWVGDDVELIYLPEHYHTMLGDMAVKHAFDMDERPYDSSVANNQFEGKLATLKDEIESGSLTILDPDGNEIITNTAGSVGKVVNTYFRNNHYDTTNDGRYNTADYNTTSDGETVTM